MPLTVGVAAVGVAVPVNGLFALPPFSPAIV